MKLRHENVYDAPASAVFAMLVDPAFRERVGVATGALSCEATYDAGRLVVREEQKVAGVPSFARKLVGDSTSVVHTEVWDADDASATFEIETPGKPTHISGRVTLTESGGRTTHRFDLDVTANVPLVGGKIEKLVAELTAAGFDTEREVGATWLAEAR